MRFRINGMKSAAETKSRILFEQCPIRHRHLFWLEVRYITDLSVFEEDFKEDDNEVTGTDSSHKIDYEIMELKIIPPYITDYISFSKSSSHSLTEVLVSNCDKEIPSIAEIIAVVDEILDTMRAQRNELRSMTHEQSLTTFHHILSVWNIHTHD